MLLFPLFPWPSAVEYQSLNLFVAYEHFVFNYIIISGLDRFLHFGLNL